MLGELYKNICDVVGAVFLWIGGLAKRFPLQCAFVVMSLIIAGILWRFYQDASEHTITLFVGPPGSSSYRISDTLVSAIESQGPSLGVKYKVKIEPTQGYIDIKQRLESDQSGQSLGMLVDGMDCPSLRTLLPMDWDYLHILARTDFLQRFPKEKLRPANETGKQYVLPREFSDIARHLEYGKVYAGPDASGTRRFAEVLYAMHQFGDSGKDLHDVHSVGLTDWNQAVAALKQGEIDVAFYCGPLGATTIKEVCEDNSAVLLGITDLRSALIKSDSFSMIPGTIPKNFYSAAPFPDAPASRWPDNNSGEVSKVSSVYFNDADIPTIAARRLIVTSKNMSETDAYIISGALADRLGEARYIPKDTWQRRSPDEETAKANSDFGIAPHAGAALKRDNRHLVRFWDPWTWNASVLTIAGGLALAAATSATQALRSWFSNSAQRGEQRSREQNQASRQVTAPIQTETAQFSALRNLRSRWLHEEPESTAADAKAEDTRDQQAKPKAGEETWKELLEATKIIASLADNKSLTAQERMDLSVQLLELGIAIRMAKIEGRLDKQQSQELIFDWRDLKRQLQSLNPRKPAKKRPSRQR
ncbi:TAXI family TRAP transporter solute-binding subunit [Anatilimnocola sp. NA78]|uniref:hypothetical protein n=1 Tax=Anatilimnocola sp. NA78 TaxID=3415683 RepID=UPI003CE56730